MLILFKFNRNNIKKLDIDDNYTFKKISIKLQKLGYTDKYIKFIYLGNIIKESQKISELYIGNNSYISVIKCKEKTERRHYLIELCNIFTDMYSQDNTLSNITNNPLLNSDLLNGINETSELDSLLDNNQLDNNQLDTDSNNSENNQLDNSSSDNQGLEEELLDNQEETSSESNLIDEDTSNDTTEITLVEDSNIQETMTDQIENILDSTISNMDFIPQSNPEERMNQLLEMGYTDRNLNQMALDINYNNINLSIGWMEQFR